MLDTIKRALWGDVTREELQEFSLLAIAFFLIIGGYWMLHTIKNTTFMHLVNSESLPYAKMVSFVSLIVIVLLYNRLVDLLTDTKLIYIVTSFYGMLFLIFAYLIGQSSAGTDHLPLWANKGLGWSIYVATESLGSLVVTLFWSFVSTSVDTAVTTGADTAEAKKGYPLIIFGGQVGGLLGTLLLSTHATKLGIPFLSCIAAGALLLIPFIIKLYTIKRVSTAKYPKKTRNITGVMEGIKLIATRPYIVGILVIATTFDIFSFFFEYQLYSAAHRTFGNLEKVTSFLGMFGSVTITTSLLFSLFCTSFFLRRFGVTACLMLYPIIIACLVTYTWIFPNIWTFFITLAGIKSLSYALNNPCEEIMYIPTSHDVRFKAKSWIDVQGARAAKASGAIITTFFSTLPMLLFYGSIISLGCIGIWIIVAHLVGKTNQKLLAENKIIE